MIMMPHQSKIKAAGPAKAPADGAETKVSLEDYIFARWGEVKMVLALLNSMDACMGTGRDHIIFELIQHTIDVADSLREALDVHHFISLFPDDLIAVPQDETDDDLDA